MLLVLLQVLQEVQREEVLGAEASLEVNQDIGERHESTKRYG
jgi:hypothetical protein